MSAVVARGVRPALAALAAAAGVVAAVAGCSSPGSSATSAAGTSPAATASVSSASVPASSVPASSVPASSVPASSGPAGTATAPGALPTASTTPLPAASGQLTGTQLQSVLLPESDFPAGFATPSTGPISSGGSLTTGKATYDLATISCATFIQHLGTVGFGETAMVSGSVSASGQAYDQFIYQFGTPSAALAFVAGVRSLAGRCGSFAATANGMKGTFSLRATPGPQVGGHPTLELLQTGTLGTNKLVLDTLLCASGVDVFAASGVGVGGAAAPAAPAKDAIVYNLMKRQAAVALLS